MTKKKRPGGKKKIASSKAGLSPCEGCPVLSHSSASQKKGDLERLIFLKLSSRPQSQPVCSHQPHTGPRQTHTHTKKSPRIYTGELPPRDTEQPRTSRHRTCSAHTVRLCCRRHKRRLSLNLTSARGRLEGG